MSFLAPYHLWLLMILPPLGIFLAWRDHVAQKRLAQFGDKTAQLSNRHQMKQSIKLGIWLLSLGMIIIAFARPTWGVSSDVVRAEGTAVIFILDISNSMDAQDILPSRLERAKLIIADLIKKLPPVQFGMVIFANEAYVQLPLTTDKRTAITFLNAISTQSITRQGTALEDAIHVALQLRDERITQQTIMIILSDGENHIGNPLIPAQQARDMGIIIHTIGLGTPTGTEIPLRDDMGMIIGSRTDAFGNIVITRLEENILMQIAQMTNGVYQRAGIIGEETTMFTEKIREFLDKQVEVQIQNQRAERFNLFVMLALAFLLIEAFIPQTKRGVA
ncbi:MAG: hypothetical protein CUN52_02890 [Phototrophicales bacterium]|nr:MAG: hypothetical protein CUN52_02890 [Phototrophicales bacterium]